MHGDAEEINASLSHIIELLGVKLQLSLLAPPISELSARNPTKKLAGDFMLVDVSLQPERDGKCGVIDFSIVTPAAESYCAEAAKTPLYAANLREEAKLLKYFQAYKQLDDIHFQAV